MEAKIKESQKGISLSDERPLDMGRVICSYEDIRNIERVFQQNPRNLSDSIRESLCLWVDHYYETSSHCKLYDCELNKYRDILSFIKRYKDQEPVLHEIWEASRVVEN